MLNYSDYRRKAIVEENLNCSESPAKMRVVSRSEIEAILSRANLEMTPPRFAVLKYLIRRDNYPTAEQIITALNRQYPRPARDTICHTLKTLRDAGIVLEVFSDDQAVHYNINIENENFKWSELEDD